MVVGLRPIRDLLARDDAPIWPELHVVIPWIVSKLLPFGVGDLELADVESVGLDDVCRRLARETIAGAVPHLERAGRNVDVVTIAVVDLRGGDRSTRFAGGWLRR